ncbi:bifunctional diaminohydroxyphosphoribosylaminopyrimidine deaminase/5-amino-6-(5-phosphoribosylamino)uracil reductase RibD [Panacagrimonas sp.]|uniref:bifunctional diaminohydroxyphosphoribosylaminopyrimidine deaminase/5-amino-6-(5-phosphoribosylamino)uracil reductase RibD n=1 Tax=Panacagrimonas sp. TaxID=2480088 RepID=UPI003B51786C
MNAQTAAAHMARALSLAGRGRYTTFPNPRVGCVVVSDGAVVGEGWHERAGEPHAEVHALNASGARARGAEVFVTLEPCSHRGRTPPCADALIAAGVGRVWAAMQDPNPQVAGQGLARLRAAGVDVQLGMLEAPARELNRGFVSRMARGRPFVTLKLAASLDGRTAMASGESQWITSDAARADVHRLRAEAGAVLSSSATVLADDPALTVRQGVTLERPPDRIVLDSAGRVPASARVWAADGARRISVGRPADVGARDTSATMAASGHPAVERIESASGDGGRLDLCSALSALAQREINSVLVECGPTLAGALLTQDCVDEVVIYLAPSLLGDAARGLANLPGLKRLEQRVALKFVDVRQVGPDLRISAIVAKGAH